jgi:pimeloyl-ACP methyl ester carboxylesterase
VTLEQWQRSGRTFSYRGHPIFYREEGEGEALLCIHGFPTASWDWHRVWPELRKHHRLIAADMIGFGLSAKPVEHDYSIFDQATLHEELLASLGITRCHVLAHDYGDTVAQELLARYEERREGAGALPELLSICFLNGGLFPESHRARLAQRLLLTPLGPLLGRLTNERSFSASLAAVFGPRTRPSREELHSFWLLLSHGGGPRILHKLIRYIEERRRFRDRWVGALREASTPLRFINGPEDPVSGRHMADRYREIVPAPDVVLLDGIGHYPQVEDPQGVLRELFTFLERVRRDAAS